MFLFTILVHADFCNWEQTGMTSNCCGHRPLNFIQGTLPVSMVTRIQLQEEIRLLFHYSSTHWYHQRMIKLKLCTTQKRHRKYGLGQHNKLDLQNYNIITKF